MDILSIAIILFTLIVAILHFLADKHPSTTLSLLIIASLLIINDILKSNEPKAIDVYRKRTALQVTFKDSIPIDTVVIFKK